MRFCVKIPTVLVKTLKSSFENQKSLKKFNFFEKIIRKALDNSQFIEYTYCQSLKNDVKNIKSLEDKK